VTKSALGFRLGEHEMQTFRSHFIAAAARSAGVTRVELLVVLAIGGVLILLILPGILNVREAARHQRCLNSIRQWGIRHLESGSSANGPFFVGMNPGQIDDDPDFESFFATTIAIIAMVGAMLAALFIRFAVRYFNRRDDRFVHGKCDEQGGSSGHWFCPPSSSPI
jgi:uncharacterized membrane protein (DUF485 family)